jgi:HK97 family phage prohead protease
MMQYKSTKFELKASNDNIIEGYASYFGNVDSYGDIIEEGAFTKTLKENKNRVKVLWQHDINEPIGKPIVMEQDSTGLYIRAKISMTDTGKKAMELMRDGVVDEMSIGYDVIKDSWSGKNRMLKELRLWEFSPVTFAANEKAKITSAKNFSDLLYDINNADVGEIKNAIERLNELLKTLEPRMNVTQAEKEVDDVQSILKMIRSFSHADTI